MPQSTWTIEEGIARFQAGVWSARLDLHRPAAGLRALVGPEGDWSTAELLAPRWSTHDADVAHEPIETYVQGESVFATYAIDDATSTRMTFQWRRVDPSPLDNGVALELIATVATEQFDVPIDLVVRTQAPADDVVRRRALAGVEFDTLGIPDRTLTLRPDEGALCLLLRWRGATFSVGALVHPDSPCTTRLERAIEDETVALRHQVFDGTLEKGVTLRGQLRVVVLPARDDEEALAALFEALAGQPPALAS